MNHLYDIIRGRMPEAGKAAIETADGQTITYGDLDASAARFAAALAAAGVGAGDRVMVQVEKSAAAISLYLGTVRAGAVFLPLNTAYTLAELDYFVADAEPRVIVVDPARAAAMAPLAKRHGARVETLDEHGRGSLADAAAGRPALFADVARGPDDLAAILYTSGTTGRSKGAMLSHDNLASNALTLAALWRFGPDDVLLHALPIFHTHGLFVATNVCLVTAGTMLFLPKFDADAVMRLMPRATAMMGVPTFYVRLVEHPDLGRATTEHMRLFVSGSAPLLADTHKRFQTLTGHAILERYGMTETNMNASNPYEGDRIPGTVGLPLPGVELRITDPQTGTPVAAGEIGMIEVRGPNVFKGYWRMPEKTREEFRSDGFFITGDLGTQDARGYVSIVGRGKDLVISGGFNVYPKEVEEEIDQIPGVVESAVVGLPHPDLGEGVTAVVVREKGATIDEAAIRAALADRLARFKQPKRVLFADALPRNAMGKVQKKELRDAHADLYAAGRA